MKWWCIIKYFTTEVVPCEEKEENVKRVSWNRINYNPHPCRDAAITFRERAQNPLNGTVQNYPGRPILFLLTSVLVV